MGLFNLTRRVGRDAAVAVTGGAAALGAAATGAAGPPRDTLRRGQGHLCSRP